MNKKMHASRMAGGALLMMAALAGCGGGGDDAGDAGLGADAAQKYVGSWIEPCATSRVAFTAAPDVLLKSRSRLILTKVSNTKLSYEMVEDIYGSADCSGTPVASHRNNARDNAYVIDGKKTIDGRMVDKLSVVHSNVGGLSSGTTIVLGNLVYPGNYFTFAAIYKDIGLLEGNQLILGDTDATLDGQGYPNQLGGGTDTLTRL